MNRINPIFSELYSHLVDFRNTLKSSKGSVDMQVDTLNMYLSITKFLDQALILPPHMIPDFQVPDLGKKSAALKKLENNTNVSCRYHYS